jgi:hypothetical protein
MEGRSLAEINNQNYRNKEMFLNGEIRLYEDGTLILSKPGPFDMSAKITNFGNGWKWGRNGYWGASSGIVTHAGSTYRLEVEVEGFPMAVSTSEMPATPVISVSIDTSVQVIKKNAREIITVGYSLNNLGSDCVNCPEKYWPFSITVDVPGDNNYFALDIVNVEPTRNIIWGIGGFDATIFTEINMDNQLLGSNLADLYLFPVLVTKNITKGVARNFFAVAPDIPPNPDFGDDYLDKHPEIEKVITTHNMVLRVRHITPASYRYVNTLSMQSSANMFNEQPVTVASNIENGYGCFSVYSAAYTTLLWWETFEYRRKEE